MVDGHVSMVDDRSGNVADKSDGAEVDLEDVDENAGSPPVHNSAFAAVSTGTSSTRTVGVEPANEHNTSSGRRRLRQNNASGMCQCGCETYNEKLYLCRGGALHETAPGYTGCQLMIDRTGGCSLSWFCHYCETIVNNRGGDVNNM